MRDLKFINDHKSVRSYETVQLPELAVLTGVNGSGKTHLLESILSGASSLGKVSLSEIKYFDFKTFYLESEAAFNSQQIDQEKIQAWDKISTNQNRVNFKTGLTNLSNKLGESISELEEISIKNNKPFLRLEESDISDVELYKKYVEYKNGYDNLFSAQAITNDSTYKSLKAFSYKLDRPIDQLSEREFKDAYVPTYLKNDFLPTQLSKIFLDYKYKEYSELVIKKSEALHYGEKPEINNVEEFIEQYGPKPWEIIEEILNSFSSLDFSISNPDDLRFRSDSITQFNVRIKNKRTNSIIPLSDLSSGEKVLFALVLSIYKSYGDRYFPKVLLLDEIDASLHPSMINNLLDVINDVFIKNHGVQVILATHSPTTIALAPEESIYIVQPNDEQSKISKQSRSVALDILTEGFMSLEQGIGILNLSLEAKINIFTEGNNILYIEKLVDLFFPDEKNKINVVRGITDRSGTKQLPILYDFFLRLEHKNNVVFVYDCDVTSSFDRNERTDYLIISKNPNNNKFKSGIENAFKEELILDEHYNETTKPKENGEIVTIKKPDKNKICKHILENVGPDDFQYFQSLVDKIRSLLV